MMPVAFKGMSMLKSLRFLVCAVLLLPSWAQSQGQASAKSRANAKAPEVSAQAKARAAADLTALLQARAIAQAQAQAAALPRLLRRCSRCRLGQKYRPPAVTHPSRHLRRLCLPR